jgi:hypothetical protein
MNDRHRSPRPHRALATLVAVVLLTLLLAACGTQVTPSATVDTDVQIPDTTKVLDSAVQAGLLAFEPDGALRYDTDAPLPQLAVGDVLVGDPSPAAPFGFLRKVVAIRQVGGETVIDTAPASLLDAIQRGSLDAHMELTPSDIASVEVHAPGLDPQAILDGFTYRFDDSVIYDRDGEESSRDDQIRASGSLEIKPVIDIDVDIDYKYYVIPYLDTFELRLGVEQHADLEITAQFEGSIDKEIDLFTYRFSSFKFSIGPVPLWVTPILTISIGAEGELQATATFEAAEDATLVGGIRYKKGEGWNNISDAAFDFTETDADFSGQLQTEAYVAAQLDLFVYDLVGPYAKIQAALKIDGKIPRDPLWTMEGCLEVWVGLNSIDLLDITYDAKVFERCRQIGAADNAPPGVRIVSPEDGGTIPLNWQVNLWAHGTDPEGGGFGCCTYSWRSNVEGELSTSYSPDVTFTTEGPRTLTVTITDADGASSSASVEVEVVNSAPDVSITRPTPDDEIHALEPVLLRGKGRDINEPDVTLGCEHLAWSSSVAGDALPQSGCEVEITFASAGPRTLTLTGTDPQGLSDSVSVGIVVLDPRPNPAPLAKILSPDNGESIGPGTRITLDGEATDPEGEAIAGYDWYFNGTYLGSGAQLDWAPEDSFSFPRCEVSFRGNLTLRAEDGSGNYGYDTIELWINRIC